MIRQQLRAAALATVLVAVAAAVWWLLGPKAAAQPGSDTPTAPQAKVAQEQLAELRPPSDLDAAEALATSFARALFSDDLEGIRATSTENLAARLLDGGVGGEGRDSAGVTVDGVTTQDMQPDEVLLQVAVRRGSADGERLEIVTVSVARTGQGWKVADAAF